MRKLVILLISLLVLPAGGAVDVESTSRTFEWYDRYSYSNQTIEKILWRDETGILDREDDIVTVEITITSEYPVELHLSMISKYYYLGNNSSHLFALSGWLRVHTNLTESGSRLSVTLDWSDVVEPEDCNNCDLGETNATVRQDKVKLWLESEDIWNQSAKVDTTISISSSSSLLNATQRFHVDESGMKYVSEEETKRPLPYPGLGMVALPLLRRRRK